MPAIKGRAVVIKRGAAPGVAVAGVRTKSISINGSPIDVTTDDDDGIRALLEAPGQLDVSISVSGIVVDEAFRAAALDSVDRIEPTSFLYDGTTNGFAGDFFLATYKETGEYQNAVTFEAEFQSSGPVVYTPAP